MTQKLTGKRLQDFCERVREQLASDQDRSQKWLAISIKVSPATISNMLASRQAVSYARALEVAKLVDIEISDLLEEPEVYVAAPMTTLSRMGLRSNHREVDQVLNAIDEIGLNPYWPGRGVTSKDETRDPRVTAAANFEALMKCRALILLYLHEVNGPSGSLIELGFAMGQGLPVTVFIHRDFNRAGQRPFILNGLRNAAMKIGPLAPVEIIDVSGVDEVTELLRANGSAFIV